MKIKYYIKEMRIHHYIKNALVFAPLACSGQFFVIPKLLTTCLGALAFCLVSSSVYIINDLADAETDKLDPYKSTRPIAAGQISRTGVLVLMCVLAGVALLLSCLCGGFPYALITIASYLVLNIVYSLWLKNVPFADIVILVSGFLLRMIMGSVVCDVTISKWLYLVVLSASFWLGLEKRYSEMKRSGSNETRKVLKKYSLSFLEKNMYVCMTLTIVFYALWSADDTTAELYGTDIIIWTVPIVMLIMMKYNLSAEKNGNGDPVTVFLHDKALMILTFAYIAAIMLILYLF